MVEGDENRTVKGAMVLSATAAIASVANLFKGKGVSAAPGDASAAILELLKVIAQAVGAGLQELIKISEAIKNLALTGMGFAPNADYPLSGRIDLNVVLKEERLPDITIPDDFAISIKSWPTNPLGGLIYVARSGGDVKNINTIWPLVPNEAVSYRIKHARNLYVSATVVPAAIAWTVEQRR